MQVIDDLRQAKQQPRSGDSRLIRRRSYRPPASVRQMREATSNSGITPRFPSIPAEGGLAPIALATSVCRAEKISRWGIGLDRWLLPFPSKRLASGRDFVGEMVTHRRCDCGRGLTCAGKELKRHPHCARWAEHGLEVRLVEPLRDGRWLAVPASRPGDARRNPPGNHPVGRHPSLSGQVIQGARRPAVGFPTALAVSHERPSFGDGVYACFVWVRKRFGVTNIEYVDFDGVERTVEAHLLLAAFVRLDLKMEVVERLRAENDLKFRPVGGTNPDGTRASCQACQEPSRTPMTPSKPDRHLKRQITMERSGIVETTFRPVCGNRSNGHTSITALTWYGSEGRSARSRQADEPRP
jgi:hypothetical protein